MCGIFKFKDSGYGVASNTALLDSVKTNTIIKVKGGAVDFEWDDDKNKSNLKKHGVSFEDAIPVFFDEHSISRMDTRKDYGEERYQIVGMSNIGVLMVAYTERHGTTMRIISARTPSKKEKRSYKQGYF